MRCFPHTLSVHFATRAGGTGPSPVSRPTPVLRLLFPRTTLVEELYASCGNCYVCLRLAFRRPFLWQSWVHVVLLKRKKSEEITFSEKKSSDLCRIELNRRPCDYWLVRMLYHWVVGDSWTSFWWQLKWRNYFFEDDSGIVGKIRLYDICKEALGFFPRITIEKVILSIGCPILYKRGEM